MSDDKILKHLINSCVNNLIQGVNGEHGRKGIFTRILVLKSVEKNANVT